MRLCFFSGGWGVKRLFFSVFFSVFFCFRFYASEQTAPEIFENFLRKSSFTKRKKVKKRKVVVTEQRHGRVSDVLVRLNDTPANLMKTFKKEKLEEVFIQLAEEQDE